MKFFIILSVICGLHLSQAFDLRACIDAAAVAAESTAGKIEGFEDWTARLNKALDNYDYTRNEFCPTLAQNDPPSLADRARITSCRTEALGVLVGQIELLADDLVNLAGGTVEISQQFLRDVRACLSRQ